MELIHLCSVTGRAMIEQDLLPQSYKIIRQRMNAMKSLLASAGVCALLVISVNTAQAKPVKADNTKQNQGALEENAVVADKQGNGKEQIKILGNIRKVIMDQKDLSMDAKNIKILVSDSNFVVLRGPVNSVEEKERLEELVKSCAGVKGIKTQLSVAVKPH